MLFFVCKTLLYRLFAYTDFFNANAEVRCTHPTLQYVIPRALGILPSTVGRNRVHTVLSIETYQILKLVQDDESRIGCGVASPLAPAYAFKFGMTSREMSVDALANAIFFMLFFVCKTLLYRLFAYTDFFNANAEVRCTHPTLQYVIPRALGILPSGTERNKANLGVYLVK